MPSSSSFNGREGPFQNYFRSLENTNWWWFLLLNVFNIRSRVSCWTLNHVFVYFVFRTWHFGSFKLYANRSHFNNWNITTLSKFKKEMLWFFSKWRREVRKSPNWSPLLPTTPRVISSESTIPISKTSALLERTIRRSQPHICQSENTSKVFLPRLASKLCNSARWLPPAVRSLIKAIDGPVSWRLSAANRRRNRFVLAIVFLRVRKLVK